MMEIDIDEGDESSICLPEPKYKKKDKCTSKSIPAKKAASKDTRQLFTIKWD